MEFELTDAIRILNSEQVTYGDVCYISASAQGFISDDASYEDAIQALYDKGQIKSMVYKDEKIPLVNIAFVSSQIWKVKGGIITIKHHCILTRI